MFGFSKPDHRTAIAVDVGSSTVGVAVICIHPDGEIENIWEHREYSIVHDDVSTAHQVKQIKTAMTNAFLELGHEGLKALKASGHSTDIDEVQAVVSAPWSYTITKTITLKDSHPFTVTNEMIGELVEAAKKQSKLVFATHKMAETLGLEITHGDVLGVSINEYPTRDPIGQEGREVSLSYTETAISKEITETLQDTVEKFFPQATITQYSFMYAFYLTMRHLRPNTSEVCLIDVTGESTEIGIVRDDILRYTTFIPAGMYTIARELAEASGVPRQEAYTYMKDDPDSLSERLPKHAQLAVEKTIAQYQEQVTALFSRTGDKLSIPKTLFMHTDARTEAFFIAQLEAASKAATGKQHQVHPVTSKVLMVPQKEDTALLISIGFLARKHAYMEILPEDI